MKYKGLIALVAASGSCVEISSDDHAALGEVASALRATESTVVATDSVITARGRFVFEKVLTSD